MFLEPNLFFEEEYFKSEYREDFLVDTTMKTVWAAEMELLSDIDLVCQKYNLQWYAYWGTLLGAVRHGGFIPWDDDIDIVMKRADYDKLMEVLPQELPDSYRVYSAMSEQGHNMFWGCVMNADTISIEPTRLRKFHNCPFYVGIDIVPLDTIPRNEDEAKRLHVFMTAIWKAVHVFEDEDRTSDKSEQLESLLSSIERGLGVTIKRDDTVPKQLWRIGTELASSYSEEDGDFLTVHTTDVKMPGFRYSKELWEEVVAAPFEEINIPIPAGYDEILRNLYGNYEVRWKGHPDHDYPFYNKQLEALRKKLEEQI